MGKGGDIRVTDCQRDFAQRVPAFDHGQGDIEPVFFYVLIRGDIHCFFEEPDEIVFFQITDFKQIFQCNRLTEIFVNIIKCEIDPGVTDHADGKMLINQEKQIVQIGFDQIAVFISFGRGICLVLLSQLKQYMRGAFNVWIPGGV